MNSTENPQNYPSNWMYKNLFWIFVSSWALIGFLPPCPGTWATIEGALIFWFLRDVMLWHEIILVVVVSILGVLSSHYASKVVQQKDPDFVVIDEVAGVWLALIGKHGIWEFLAAVVLFRVIDITKPFPIKRLERFPGGWGIMIDDLFAGFLTNVLVTGLFLLLKHFGWV